MIGWLRNARGRTLVLAVSLAVNLFLASMVIGRAAGQAVVDSQTRRSIQAMLAPLPEAKRKLVVQEIAAVMPSVREQLAALQMARASLAAEMVMANPDPAALERGFAAVQTHTTAIGTELQRAIVRALPRLTQDERRAMVQALARRDSSGALPLP